jgi:hypothetical protein
MVDLKRTPAPQTAAANDPRDMNKDGMIDASEQKAWKSQSPDDAYAKWGYDLEVIKTLGLADFFHAQFEQYKANPNGWSPDAFMRDLKKQPEFQQYSAAYQSDLQFELTNRPQWEADVQANMETLRDAATKMGAQLDDNTLRDLAVKQRRGGLNPSQMNNALSGYLSVVGGRYAGDAGTSQDSLSKWAKTNGLPISDDSLRGYVQKVASGDQTADDVKNTLRRTYLAGMYPAWADKINEGYDPADLFSPYLESAKTLLEDTNIDLSDPLVQKLTQGVSNDGKPTVVPLYQAQQMVRQDPRWQYTNNAYATYTSVADNLLKTFGFR